MGCTGIVPIYNFDLRQSGWYVKKRKREKTGKHIHSVCFLNLFLYFAMAVQKNTTNIKINTETETRRNERKKRYRMVLEMFLVWTIFLL
uniref:Uncharacterized protein n=1 Tax=Salvator merianae TaxID=96440 RepID=A0A8D0DRF3_SALMN